MAFHTAKTPQEMLQQMREYLDKKIFTTDIVDVVIGLCCNIFNVTLWIFKESEAGQLESISYSTNKKSKSDSMFMLPCTVTEEMYMVLAVITMLLLAKRKTGANSTWTFHQDHPPQGKYLLLCHHPHMNQMTSTPLLMDQKCCLTSAVNQMHQCTIYPLHSNVFYSLWNYLKTWTMSK